jgi:outer membrane protein
MRIRCAVLLLSLTVSFPTLAQTAPSERQQKIGHADWEYIFKRLPQYKQIEIELKSFESQLQSQLKLKNEELERKYKAFQGLPENTPEAIRQDKASELSYLQGNLEKFQQEAQVSMQKKQNELVAPIFDRVGKAIEEVAIENGFAYIINPQTGTGGDVLLYVNQKYNISDLVLSKLGVTTAR